MKLLIKSDGGFLARNLWAGICRLLGLAEQEESLPEQEALDRLEDLFSEAEITLFLSPLVVSHDVLARWEMSGLPMRVGSERPADDFSFSSAALAWLREQISSGKLHIWEDQAVVFSKYFQLAAENNAMWIGLAEQVRIPDLSEGAGSRGNQEHIDDDLIVVECNLDDMSGEGMGYTMERLLQAGVRDVFYTPIIMKKNRPAYCLTVLCDRGMLEQVKQLIFLETTTFGIRYTKMSSYRLGREWERVVSPWGEIRIKWAQYKGDRIKGAPEYEDCRNAAVSANIPFRVVYQWAEDYVSRNKPIV
jgi:pyridinium-3,5-bisthiocarboxylic acid mononucleotide nickel chelatase